MSIQELETLIELAVKYGVKRLKTQDVEIEVGAGPSIEIPQKVVAVDSKLIPSEQEISNQDMLFWSVEAPVKEEDSK